jgi:hypothetical protein
MVKPSVKLWLIVGVSVIIGLSGAASSMAATGHQRPSAQARCPQLPRAYGDVHAARPAGHQQRRPTAARGSIVVYIPRVVFIRTATNGCVSITTNTGELPQPADIFYDLRHGPAKIATPAVRSWILRASRRTAH